MEISKPAKIGGVGQTELEFVTNRKAGDKQFKVYFPLSVNVSLQSVDNLKYLYSKKIVVTPRFILVNKTQH